MTSTTARAGSVDDAALRIAVVRRFSRFYTQRMGVLDEMLLGSGLTLPEGRIVYEIAARGTATASALSQDLAIDPGYVSRLVKGLTERGYVSRRASLEDGRRTLLELTEQGRAKFDEIDRRSAEEVGRLLATLAPGEQQRLVVALETAERLLSPEPRPKPTVVLRPPRPGDIGWVVHRHGALYAAEYGFDATFEALVAKVAAEFVETADPSRERCWIAEVDRRVVGSVLLVRKSDEDAKLRLLYVEPEARGLGIGRNLVDECIATARLVGYRRMTLWTNSVLDAARRIYVRAGFELVATEPHHSFGRDLVGETWERDL